MTPRRAAPARLLVAAARRCTYANVTATVCLFVVLGGSSVAEPLSRSAATSASPSVRQAVRIAKAAKRTSRRALATAQAAERKASDALVTPAPVPAAVPPPSGGDPTIPALRALGTAADQAAAGDDPRLADARTPAGPAGGVLDGSYPNPGIAANAIGGAAVDEGTLVGTAPGLVAGDLTGDGLLRFQHMTSVGSFGTECNPTSAGYIGCSSITHTGHPIHGSKVLIFASATWWGQAAGEDRGSCVLRRDDTSMQVKGFGQSDDTHDTVDRGAEITFVDHASVGPNQHLNIGIDCAENAGDVRTSRRRILIIRLAG